MYSEKPETFDMMEISYEAIEQVTGGNDGGGAMDPNDAGWTLDPNG